MVLILVSSDSVFEDVAEMPPTEVINEAPEGGEHQLTPMDNGTGYSCFW